MKKPNLLIFLTTTIAFILTAGSVMAVDPALYFNANDSVSGVDSANWKSLTDDSSRDWGFGDDVTLEDVSTSVPTITKAYRFTGVAGDSAGTWDGYSSTSDATFEVWVKPSDTGEANQTIFETGASGVGVAVWYTVGTEGDNTGTINFTIDGGSVNDTVSAVIDTTEFHQIIMVFDKDIDGSVDRMKIFVDGILIDENTDTNPTDINDWSGGDGAGLGKSSNGQAPDGGSAGLFTGDLSVLRFWRSTVLTDVEVMQYYLQNFISPANGGYALAGDVTLEWVNLDPNTTVDPENKTYVDVWFGTDSDKASGNYTKVVSGAENMTSLTVTPPGAGIYYWQVDSYLDGILAEPNMVEGLVNTFTNDSAPFVDAGADMVTLYGLATQLNPGIVDDGSSELTYSWTVSSVLPNGLEVSFDANNVAGPIVTFTKVPYTNANIANASFEEGGSNPGWTMTGSGNTGAYKPGDDMYGGIAPDGDYLLYLNKGVSASQVLSETVQDGATYTLSAVVGFDSRWNVSSIYTVQLLAGSGDDEVVLAEDSAFIDDPNAYYPSVVTYTIDPIADADKIGLHLQIRLTCDPNALINAFFDNVVLTSDPQFPEIAGVSSVDLTVTVQDATNEGVSDSMTVDIYDDGCRAAREGIGRSYPVDFDENCVIELDDLLPLAVNWLNDFALPAPTASNSQSTPNVVANGGFTFYKPGTNYTVTALFNATDGYVNGVGDNLAVLNSGKTVDYSDETTGALVDIPGWAAAEGTTPQFYRNYGVDGTTALTVFAAWNRNGSRAESAEPVCYVSGGRTYTVSAKASGGIFGDPNLVTRLEIQVDGETVTPATPLNTTVGTGNTEHQDIYVTYDAASLAPYIGKPMKVVVGTGPSPNSSKGGRGWMDNVALEVVVDNNDLPTVEAGDDMVTWSGNPMDLTPAVDNNDSQNPQRALSYLWTAEPADGVVFSDPVNPADPNTSGALAPTVTVTKPAGDAARVTLILTVTLEGETSVCDHIMLDVYDDACKAGMGENPGQEFDLTDLNTDCITNLVDFAGLAEFWMVDYSLITGETK